MEEGRLPGFSFSSRNVSVIDLMSSSRSLLTLTIFNLMCSTCVALGDWWNCGKLLNLYWTVTLLKYFVQMKKNYFFICPNKTFLLAKGKFFVQFKLTKVVKTNQILSTFSFSCLALTIQSVPAPLHSHRHVNNSKCCRCCTYQSLEYFILLRNS